MAQACIMKSQAQQLSSCSPCNSLHNSHRYIKSKADSTPIYIPSRIVDRKRGYFYGYRLSRCPGSIDNMLARRPMWSGSQATWDFFWTCHIQVNMQIPSLCLISPWLQRCLNPLCYTGLHHLHRIHAQNRVTLQRLNFGRIKITCSNQRCRLRPYWLLQSSGQSPILKVPAERYRVGHASPESARCCLHCVQVSVCIKPHYSW